MTDPTGIGLTRDHHLWPLYCDRPTVRILFYTDTAEVIARPDRNGGLPDFSTWTLREALLSSNSIFVSFEVDLLNRYDGAVADGAGQVLAKHKLTPKLLTGYDQVWFFGINQCDTPGAGGLPDNELTVPEVRALQAWMNTGGVLMTGDHANSKPPSANGLLPPLLGLGRALGHRVPRAGQLRKWDGLPSAGIGMTAAGDPMGPRENHNTQQPNPPLVLDSKEPQSDALPQPLYLQKYPRFPLGGWERRWAPHPLFCGRNGPIEVFPDHMHEGMLSVQSAQGVDWPAGGVGPEVVASGLDTRTGRLWPVVAAYDGELAGVGRIVADSTWHHYFHINLVGFDVTSAVWAQITDYYLNLAIWLSPAAKRDAMRCAAFWWLLRNGAVHEVSQQSIQVIGQQAMDVLGRVANRCMMIEFMLPSGTFTKVEWPPHLTWPVGEWLVGGILYEYQRAAASGQPIESRHVLQRRGIERALGEHLETFESAAAGVRQFIDQLDEILDAGELEPAQ